MMAKVKWIVPAVIGALAVFAGGVATSGIAASPTAVTPTVRELESTGISFTPAPVPGGVISATKAINDLLLANGGTWTKFPSGVRVASFGYVSDSQIKALSEEAVRADSSLRASGVANSRSGLSPARVKNVPVWEVTFGGVQLPTPAPYLPPGSRARTDGAVCSDDTAFIDAKTGQELWEMWNDCTPVTAAPSS